MGLPKNIFSRKDKPTSWPSIDTGWLQAPFSSPDTEQTYISFWNELRDDHPIVYGALQDLLKIRPDVSPAVSRRGRFLEHTVYALNHPDSLNRPDFMRLHWISVVVSKEGNNPPRILGCNNDDTVAVDKLYDEALSSGLIEVIAEAPGLDGLNVRVYGPRALTRDPRANANNDAAARDAANTLDRIVRNFRNGGINPAP